MLKVKVLITGISGFIGKTLVESLTKQDNKFDIYGIDIKQPEFTDQNVLNRISFSLIDIRNAVAVKDYFDNNSFDVLIHLAAVSRVVDAEKDKQNCIDTNYLGTKYILEQIRNKNTKVIFGSSREVYGEQSDFPVKENAEKHPINIYGECKLNGELMVKDLIKEYVILRFSNVYGNIYDIQDRVIPKFVNQAINNETLCLEGGNQVIDFTHIADTVNAIIKCMNLMLKGAIQQEEMHICPGRYNKITDIISILEEKLNKKIAITIRNKRNYDVVQFMGDTTKRKQILGDENYISLEKGLTILISSYHQSYL